MKKFFGLHDKDEEQNLKTKLMSFTGIDSKYISFVDVHLSQTEFLHVFVIDDLSYEKSEDLNLTNTTEDSIKSTEITPKKDLVMLHGLASSAVLYYKMLKPLAKEYRIYGIDLPGMGCSSKYNIHFKDLQETEDFFVEKLKQCFQILNLEKFILLGHSFGGYISCLFTIRYSYMIDRVILLSPVGMSSKYVDIVSTKMEDFFQRLMYKQESSPFLIFKLFGEVSNKIFNHFSKTKFSSIKVKEEFETVRDYINNLIRGSTSIETACYKFFNKNLQAYKPVTYHYDFLKDIKIMFLYGDKDWSPKSQAEDLQNLLPDTVEIYEVANAGHLLHIDNADECVERVLKFCNK